MPVRLCYSDQVGLRENFQIQ